MAKKKASLKAPNVSVKAKMGNSSGVATADSRKVKAYLYSAATG